MNLLPFIEWTASTSLNHALTASPWAFAVTESIHLLALSVLGGAVLIVDLRLLGFGLRTHTVEEVAREAQPWFLGSWVVIVTTGVLLFVSEPQKLYFSAPFAVKMWCLLLGTTFALTVRRTVGWFQHSATGGRRAIDPTRFVPGDLRAANGRYRGPG